MAQWLMAQADHIHENGELSMIELQAFLPDHPFTEWFTRRPQNLLRYDQVIAHIIRYDQVIAHIISLLVCLQNIRLICVVQLT